MNTDKISKIVQRAAIDAAANSLYFGNVWVGRSETITVAVRNSGNAAVNLSGETMVGSGYSVSGITLPKTLNAGATVLLSVKFGPAKLGSVTGKLQMISNAANGTLVVPLYGAGVASQATTASGCEPCGDHSERMRKPNARESALWQRGRRNKERTSDSTEEHRRGQSDDSSVIFKGTGFRFRD